MSEHEHFDPHEIAQAILDNRGMITAAARQIGCTSRTVYNYRDRYPDLIKPAIEEARKRMGDAAEVALYDMIEDRTHPDHWKATRYYLNASPEGKSRGYGERREVTGKDGGAIHIAVDDVIREVFAGDHDLDMGDDEE